ncbi:hypothetical protein EBI_22555 [Enterocytozoon bieneusi H348]|nr:hypothetical protein EBI_22555 [Enterocytozoon bieneusi H348]|eukprot:XP_001827984.1 hypothetical protein EBI_22555 [Enterocytozoon bieneusi H348]
MKIKDRIKYLKHIKKTSFNIYWTEEIIKTFLYYEEPQQAKNYLKHFEFTNKRCNYLHLYINTFEKLALNKFDLQDITNNIDDYLSHLKLFIPLIEHYQYKINYLLLVQNNLSALSLTNLYYLYERSNAFEFLEMIVQRDPFINKDLYKKYSVKNGVNKKDIFRILMVHNCDWAMCIAIRWKWIPIN